MEHPPQPEKEHPPQPEKEHPPQPEIEHPPQQELERSSQPTSQAVAVSPFEQDVRDFEALSTQSFCTDKTTGHRYQHLYATVLQRYRHPVDTTTAHAQSATSTTTTTTKKSTKKFKMLEIGLGCIMWCVAGSFKLMQDYLPDVEYHSFEFAMSECRAKYKDSNVSTDEAAYIESHLCEGSSADPEALRRCGEKFGPFDIIIDDASHQSPHIIAAYSYLFPSQHLKPGGTYIIEDLQAQFSPGYAGGVGARNVYKLIGDVLMWKLAMLPNGQTMGDVPEAMFSDAKQLATLTRQITCGPEICAFEKMPVPQ